MKYATAFGFAFIGLYLLTVVRRFEPDRRVSWILCALVYVAAGLAIAPSRNNANALAHLQRFESVERAS